MTKVIVSIVREDGPAYFEVMGHTGYKDAETGYNDVCVAISTMICMFGHWVEQEYGIEPDILIDGHARFDIEKSNLRINELLRAIENECKILSEQYPEHVKVY